YEICVRLLGMEKVAFLVQIPVAFIFGSIVVLNLLRNPFSEVQQPVRGWVNVVLAALIGGGLSQVYKLVAILIYGPLSAGPPSYEQEIWLASALLAVTFPLLVFSSAYFQLWPLEKDLKG
ncbi:MAG: hypothetical protein M3N41_02335, partial [Acidobacteriota bacterium]|nr:hypothetical protein [Acidobacteriota bacterium]